MDPRRMKAMLRQFGIKSEDINAKRVIFELESGKLVIENPQVTAMDIQGKKTYTVMGEAKDSLHDGAGDSDSVEEETSDAEEGAQEIPESDVEMVAEKAKATKAKARKALEETGGDIAEAIEKLK